MKYDVIIIGAGPAGLSFACSLKDSGIQVLVLESASKTSLQLPVEDGREIALTHSSVQMMQELGAWQHIDERDIAPICAAKVFDGNSDYSLDFDSTQEDLSALGFLVPNNVIRESLYQVVESIKNVTIRCESPVLNLSSDQDSAWVELEDEKIQCSLLVSADSRFSQTRRKMGIAASMNDFSRSAIVCRMSHTLSHNKTALECFQYASTLAVLPMQGNKSSIVVTLSNDEVEKMQSLSDEEFAQTVESRLKGKLGSMHLASKRHVYPLVGVHAKQFIANRFAVIGDAAVGMHPVTAHGFNLGLRSQKTLVKEVLLAQSKQQDIGSTKVLERYQRQHMIATRVMYHGTNLVVGLFTNDSIGAKVARKLTMRFANNFAPIKNVISAKLTEKLANKSSLPFW